MKPRQRPESGKSSSSLALLCGCRRQESPSEKLLALAPRSERPIDARLTGFDWPASARAARPHAEPARSRPPGTGRRREHRHPVAAQRSLGTCTPRIRRRVPADRARSRRHRRAGIRRPPITEGRRLLERSRRRPLHVGSHRKASARAAASTGRRRPRPPPRSRTSTTPSSTAP